jgi:nucleotide-binding universal stress UspA family protein
VFKNILVPTDGSSLSREAALQAVELAKRMGARITAFHVAQPYRPSVSDDYRPAHGQYVGPLEFEAHTEAKAREHLEMVDQAACAEHVPCETHYVHSDYTADAIVDAAKRYHCDAIVMASHGRTGLAKVWHGSQTQKVLEHTKVPVVVLHP